MSQFVIIAIIFAAAIQKSFGFAINSQGIDDCSDIVDNINTVHQHIQRHITQRFCWKNKVSFNIILQYNCDVHVHVHIFFHVSELGNA